MALQAFQRSLAAAVQGRRGQELGRLLRLETGPGAPSHRRQHDLAEAARALGLDTVGDAACWSGLGLPAPWDAVAASTVLCIAHLDAGDIASAYSAARDAYKAVLSTATDSSSSTTFFSADALCAVVKTLQATATRCDREVPPGSSAAAMEDDAGEGGCRADAANRLGDALTAALRTMTGVGTCLLQLANVRLAQCLQLHSAELAASTLQTLQTGWDHGTLLPLESFPRSQIVTFWYLSGVQALLSGRLDDADRDLSSAFSACPAAAKHNKRIILCRLVATALIQRDRLPSAALLETFGLTGVYGGIVAAIRRGNLALYDNEISRNAAMFARWGVYLPLERARGIVWRNIIRRVWLSKSRFVELERAAGRDSSNPMRKPSVLPLQAVLTAARVLSGTTPTSEVTPNGLCAEEVECMAATLITEGRVRGYIEPKQHLLVLSSTKAFPVRGAVTAASSTTPPATTPALTPPFAGCVSFDMAM